jgi:serine protease Do
MLNSSHYRKQAFGIALVLATLSGGCATQRKAAFPDASPANVVSVTEAIFPAVVRLDVAQEVYENGKRTLRRGIGSGVIIDADGHILTNYHVAGRSAEIFITLYNKERVRARLIGDDHWTDLAVVQLDMDEIRRKNITFAHAELGDSSKLVEGQPVMAIGTPFGLTRTTTLGIVSNTNRTFYPQRQQIDEYETGEFSNWIQMDTPIAPGNSGGPLVDLSGRVVGINTRGFQGQSLNFAIPVNTAREVVTAILANAAATAAATPVATETTPTTGPAAAPPLGRVSRADLGLELKPMQDLETFFEIDINQGVLINSVERRSPAAAAGVKPQDVLVAINGQSVNARFPEEIAPLKHTISRLALDQPATLTVRRGRETLTLTATPDKLESAVGEERELKQWGLSVRDITRAYANDNQLDDDQGVVITTLSAGLPGAKAELRAGDILRAVNGTDVKDLQEFVRLYNESVSKKEERVLVEVLRGRGKQTMVLRVTYQP